MLAAMLFVACSSRNEVKYDANAIFAKKLEGTWKNEFKGIDGEVNTTRYLTFTIFETKKRIESDYSDKDWRTFYGKCHSKTISAYSGKIDECDYYFYVNSEQKYFRLFKYTDENHYGDSFMGPDIITYEIIKQTTSSMTLHDTRDKDWEVKVYNKVN